MGREVVMMEMVAIPLTETWGLEPVTQSSYRQGIGIRLVLPALEESLHAPLSLLSPSFSPTSVCLSLCLCLSLLACCCCETFLELTYRKSEQTQETFLLSLLTTSAKHLAGCFITVMYLNTLMHTYAHIFLLKSFNECFICHGLLSPDTSVYISQE